MAEPDYSLAPWLLPGGDYGTAYAANMRAGRESMDKHRKSVQDLSDSKSASTRDAVNFSDQQRQMQDQIKDAVAKKQWQTDLQNKLEAAIKSGVPPEVALPHVLASNPGPMLNSGAGLSALQRMLAQPKAAPTPKPGYFNGLPATQGLPVSPPGGPPQPPGNDPAHPDFVTMGNSFHLIPKQKPPPTKEPPVTWQPSSRTISGKPVEGQVSSRGEFKPFATAEQAGALTAQQRISIGQLTRKRTALEKSLGDADTVNSLAAAKARKEGHALSKLDRDAVIKSMQDQIDALDSKIDAGTSSEAAPSNAAKKFTYDPETDSFGEAGQTEAASQGDE